MLASTLISIAITRRPKVQEARDSLLRMLSEGAQTLTVTLEHHETYANWRLAFIDAARDLHLTKPYFKVTHMNYRYANNTRIPGSNLRSNPNEFVVSF